MPRPYELIDSAPTDEGLLELRQRGERDFMISVGGRVLMTSALTTTELALAQEGCRTLASAQRPRVLIGGLGLGYTLRAALDALPPTAEVTVAELNAKVVEWNRGPLAILHNSALADLRTRIVVGDVMAEIRRVALAPKAPRYDAILWDLYVGPKRTGGARDPLYGDASIEHTRAALRPGGVFGVWAEEPSRPFEARLRKQGMQISLAPSGGRGVRHAVYMARAKR